MARARGSLRATSVGYAFHHPDVRDVSFGSGQTLLGQDVVLLQISGLQGQYATSVSTYRGKLSLGSHASARISEDIARRKREFKTLLELGGTLVLFLPAPDSWYVDTGERQYSGTGRNQKVTTIVKEQHLLDVLPFSITTVPAETREMELRIGEPFASFWREHGYRFETSAVLSEALGETALVIEGTQSITASIARLEKGLVVVLPETLLYPADEEEVEKEEEKDDDESVQMGTDNQLEPHSWDVEFLEGLLDLVRSLRSSAGDYQQPTWITEYHLPGEREAADDVRKASARLAKAQEKLDFAERALALRDQRKILLTGTGPALEVLVEEALRALGLDVDPARPGRTDRVARLGGQPAVVEIKGVTKSAGEKDAAQLEKWVSEYQLEHSMLPKGILVVNGWRNTPVNERIRPVFPDQMLRYSEARGHCLISSVQLLGAWLDAETHPGRRKAIAKSIFECVGRYSEYSDWSQYVVHQQAAAEVVKSGSGEQE